MALHDLPRRFMVLTSARTGSNLLLSLLSSHPSIKTHGELFKLDVLTDQALTAALEDPVRYLQRVFCQTKRDGVSAVGFKMFYYHMTEAYIRPARDAFYTLYHLQDPSRRVSDLIERQYEWAALQTRFETLWEHLAADRELRVIHLKRRNLFDALVSLKRAFQTRQWWSLRPAPDNGAMVRLAPAECATCFEVLAAFERQADQRFAHHHKFELFYEDLVGRRQSTLAELQRFLAVPPCELSTRLTKIVVSGASQCVQNYDELKDHFKATQWSKFFL